MMRKWRLTEFMDDAIAAFAVAEEMEPGVVAINDAAVRGVHITKLKLDGSSKADTERNKIIIAGCVGSPIVLAPVNDLLGLAIGAGIEDALSTGLGGWAAGRDEPDDRIPFN
jgi:hypothetical protein